MKIEIQRAEAQRLRNLYGSAYMMIAMFCFVANDALVRSVGTELPTTQIMFLRGLFVVFLITLVLFYRANRLRSQQTSGAIEATPLSSQFKAAVSPIVLARSLLDLAGTFAFLYALIRMPFANVAAVLQCLPLIVTLGAALFFREKVGIWRWSAIVVGFIGVLIILRPGVSGFSVASLWLLVTVLLSAGRDLLSRSLPPNIPTMMVTLSTAATIMLGGLLIGVLSGNWSYPNLDHLWKLAIAAVFLFGAYHFIVLTMRTGETGFVSPFRYTSLLWAGLAGWLVFEEIPDSFTVIGSLIVVSMGLLTLHRENRIRKASNP